MQNSNTGKPRPNLWTESTVRRYLGFEPTGGGFEEFAESLLEPYYPRTSECSDLPETRYYWAEQFACGSVIPGIRALWEAWPSYDWKEFSDWMAGSAPETSASRRDFLAMGGVFTRVWRELWEVRKGLGE